MEVFQAQPEKCFVLIVTVLRGRNITLGNWADLCDNPDPYVLLFVPTAPNGRRRTRTVHNERNPEWNETFQFLLDPNETNTLHVSLKESDIIFDDCVGGTQKFEVNDFNLNDTVTESICFGKASYVDIVIQLTADSESPADLRYSSELCCEELQFLEERKKVVFQAMKNLLGDRAPRTYNEVPTVAVLGSGGGFRAMIALSGVCSALADMKIMECITYNAGLSGSAWYLSTLYSHPMWPNIHPREIMTEIRKNVSSSWMKLLFTPSWMYDRIQKLKQKNKCGQPVSFTDFFGYLVGDTLLKQRDTEPRLSHQRDVVKKGKVPLPIYTCLHVKENESAKNFSEWIEFTPYEIGMARYGTFLKTHLFGNKFFLGKLLTNNPEPVLQYEQGIWGSAFTMLLQQILQENRHPMHVHAHEIATKHGLEGDGRNKLEEMAIRGDYVDGNTRDDESDEEEANDDDSLEGSWGNETSAESAQAVGSTSQSSWSDNADGFWDSLASNIIDKFDFLKTRSGRAGRVHNFLRGLKLQQISKGNKAEKMAIEVTKMKRLYVVDSGLLFNSPYPPLLRPQRGVDLYISFDFSARKKDFTENPLQELALAERWAKANNLLFPPINAEETFDREGMKEFYVFRDPSNTACPVIIHFVLVNKTFREFKKPGIPRSETESTEADFYLFEDPKELYSTFKFHYRNENFDRLTQLMEFNTLLGGEMIRDLMAECVSKRRHTSLTEPSSNSAIGFECELKTNAGNSNERSSPAGTPVSIFGDTDTHSINNTKSKSCNVL